VIENDKPFVTMFNFCKWYEESSLVWRNLFSCNVHPDFFHNLLSVSPSDKRVKRVMKEKTSYSIVYSPFDGLV